MISASRYSAVLPGTAVLRRVAPARRLLSARRALQPPRSGAHNAATVNLLSGP